MTAAEFLEAKDKHAAETFALSEATPQSPRLVTPPGEDWCIEAWIDPATTHSPAAIMITAGKRQCQWRNVSLTLRNAQMLRDWLCEMLPK